MNISNVNGQTAMFGQVPPATTGIKPTMPIKESERSAATNKTQQDSANQKTTANRANIIIDEQAIALFKENQAQQSAYTSVNSTQLSSVQLNAVNTNREKLSSASPDKPSIKNETAVANYQAVGNLAQRESVQKMFGVDLFA